MLYSLERKGPYNCKATWGQISHFCTSR